MMKVVETISDMKAARVKMRGGVGFVPTMGFLHEGHLTLARRSKAENGVTGVSIFVNPTQFGPQEDFAKYPRDTERDLAMLRKEGVDFVFMPSGEEMYPKKFSTWVNVEKVTDRLEGAVRPGHFRGVATVVAKLFNIVEPTRSYFGQKDAQQVVVIKRMVADLNMNLQIVVVPTVREADGLAMSSRNVYLSADQRRDAAVLSRSLFMAQKLSAAGERDAERLRQEITKILQTEPSGSIDYVSIADAETLEELTTIDRPAIASLVVKFGKTRLLDNVVLD